MKSNGITVLNGPSNFPLTQKIAKVLKQEVYNPVTQFADSEIRVNIPKI